MKEFVELNKWWSSLPVTTKEEAMGCDYPSCTAAWNELTLEEKNIVYDKMGVERAKRNHTKGFT